MDVPPSPYHVHRNMMPNGGIEVILLKQGLILMEWELYKHPIWDVHQLLIFMRCNGTP